MGFHTDSGTGPVWLVRLTPPRMTASRTAGLTRSGIGEAMRETRWGRNTCDFSSVCPSPCVGKKKVRFLFCFFNPNFSWEVVSTCLTFHVILTILTLRSHTSELFFCYYKNNLSNSLFGGHGATGVPSSIHLWGEADNTTTDQGMFFIFYSFVYFSQWKIVLEFILAVIIRF